MLFWSQGVHDETTVLSSLKLLPLKSNHGKAEVTSKIIRCIHILEWGCDQSGNTKLLFVTEQAAEKVQGRISLKAPRKDYYQETLLFIWTFEKWELPHGRDHSLVLMKKLFLCLLMPQGISTPRRVFPCLPCNSPGPTQEPQREALKAESIWTFCVLAELDKEKNGVCLTPWNKIRGRDCHFNSTIATSPRWETED